ncbi:MAG: ribosome biogenesis GTP-binding protein YihA/YsxC [Alphaproteobacteria bacterium]|nr:ribosome biogenesis GTP-binding protein YihA/YsxC [Alphaproteobacteria bacterium]
MTGDFLPLFRMPCTFMAGAASVASLPVITHPEVAFIGRSNVGKSSLVNALIGQKALAKTSQNPGATKQLNFFLLGEQLILVDMPGYGFAKVSKEKKGEWDHLIKSYLCGRPNLKRALVLIDARRGVMQVDDDFMRILDDSAVNFQIVLTKADALKPSALAEIQDQTIAATKRHVAAHPLVLTTSSLSKIGMRELQEEIIPFAGTL